MEIPITCLVSGLHYVCGVCFAASIKLEASGRAAPQRVSEFDHMLPLTDLFSIALGALSLDR